MFLFIDEGQNNYHIFTRQQQMKGLGYLFLFGKNTRDEKGYVYYLLIIFLITFSLPSEKYVIFSYCFKIRKELITIKLRMKMRSVSRIQQPDQRAKNSL